MSFDKPTRNLLAKIVAQCRDWLADDIADQLQSAYGLHPDGTVLDVARTEDDRRAAEDLRALWEHFEAAEAGSAAARQTAAYPRLVREIRLERNLTMSEPRIIGAAAVLPLAAPEPEAEPITYEPHTPEPMPSHDERAEYTAGAGMRRDDEIEEVGMQVTMAYERRHGWRPEDVSGENHGFDVRSSRYDDDGSFADVRYIEVKTRARSGAIRLSANEWKKARHFGDKYWLYIITQAATDAPQLQRVQDPAVHFQLDEDIFATGFIIPEEKWARKAH